MEVNVALGMVRKYLVDDMPRLSCVKRIGSSHVSRDNRAFRAPGAARSHVPESGGASPSGGSPLEQSQAMARSRAGSPTASIPKSMTARSRPS